MKRKHGADDESTTSSPRNGAILPLPADVIAQIKSSTAIVSLTGVVLELLKNSLDAGATKTEASVDFSHGACSVEDDGLGILPSEFREDGGLGKLYWTSKYLSEDSCLGRNGTFCASLAAVSLLTITSHHHEYRSHNSVTFHHATSIDREVPAAPRHELNHSKHGTRVVVRNLFGNLPVRVKQRAVLAEQKAEHDRLWEGLRREVTSLWLSWEKPVSLRLRDAEHKTILSVNTQRNLMGEKHNGKSRSQELRWTLSVLTQLDWINVDNWASWIPASASTPNISISGAISLDPGPTKRVQFVALGTRPLSAEAGHNELFDEINRLFSHSSFGTAQDDVEIDEREKIRRQNDRRFKTDGYTNRQLKARKGVDRYPMFYLRIVLKRDGAEAAEDDYLSKETNVQAILEVLSAMIMQWLSVHHFRPRKRRAARTDRLMTPSTSVSEAEGSETETQSRSQSRTPLSKDPRLRSNASNSELPGSRKQKRKAKAMSCLDVNLRQQQLFSDWSRIKSARPLFPSDLCTSAEGGQGLNTENGLLKPRPNTEPATTTATLPQQFAKFSAEPVPVGSLSGIAHNGNIPQEGIEVDGTPSTVEKTLDEVMTWTNPATKEALILNSRTGCAVPRLPLRPSTAFNSATDTLLDREPTTSLRLPKRVKTTGSVETPWLDGVLRSWDNPIFKPTEPAIRQVTLEEQDFANGGCGKQSRFCSSQIDIEKAFSEASASNGSKLSKEGLLKAQVISQLDKKFILVKISISASPRAEDKDESEILVLIDQHAADERIQVESLLADLCAPLPANRDRPQYRSKLGFSSKVAFAMLDKPLHFSISKHERQPFITHAARFAQWGILYDILSPEHPLSQSTSTTAEKEQGGDESSTIISVTALPPTISERCKSDPKLLISLLRSTVWKYADEHTLRSSLNISALNSSNEANDSDPNSHSSPLWLQRISTCPPGLLDLVNSRACRSAIMFNDPLTLQQCQEVVGKLAGCVFPFMCAHGRPSMVPLVNLGGKSVGVGLGLGGEGQGDGAKEKRKEGGFVDVWKVWRGKGKEKKRREEEAMGEEE